MGKPKLLSCFFFVLLLWSCRPDGKYPYAINGFRKELQPALTQLVTKGIVGYPDSVLKEATDKELEQLGNSEHPILRAAAFRVMLDRKSFDHFKIMMNHLDDTALVFIDAGEWGALYKTVSDDIIYHTLWKTIADKNKTIEAVITRHNYLRSAYFILNSLEPQEKYYSYIKEMAGRQNYRYAWFDNPESALFGLAKFKKQEDIPFIKDRLLENSWRMTDINYRLLNEYPDPSYMEVFEKIYPRQFYKQFCQKRNPDGAIDFINAVAVYKNLSSAAILDSILNKKDLRDCMIKPGWLQDAVAQAVWDNPCEAYILLRKQVAQRIKELDKLSLPVEDYPAPDLLNKTEENIRW